MMCPDDYVTEAEAMDDWADEDFADEIDYNHPGYSFAIMRGPFGPETVHLMYGRPMFGHKEVREPRLVTSKPYNRMEALELYEKAKAAKVGESVCCAACKKSFTKKSYQQAFCSNKGKNNCKDIFWNRAKPERTERAKAFASRQR